ncbi:hypothetical protein PSE_4155 [Pseudovibrio sp. FO-BEG1]|nr:hypothetical protein PSE_4155 [Pseudovibrio sp. FO-BEG1]
MKQDLHRKALGAGAYPSGSVLTKHKALIRTSPSEQLLSGTV